MSTFYALACTQCRRMTDLVKRSALSGWYWIDLEEAKKAVPTFIAAHFDHLDKLRIIAEDDSEYESYADSPTTAVRSDGSPCCDLADLGIHEKDCRNAPKGNQL